jgi:hypothetical protein
MKNYYYGKYIQDGKLDSSCGRLIIFSSQILHSEGPSRDHNDLMRSFASRFRMNKDEVISKCSRYYFKREGNSVIISPVRKIDDEDFCTHREEYRKLIMDEIK